jgi:hypothetical protein
MVMAQSANNYKRINGNIGHGEDMSLILDVPYKEWSQAFKPHNWAFFVLPFDMAFAFKWWLLAYFLVMSCYFFVLALLPKHYLLASSLAVALLFSAFVQWWYQYATLAPIYTTLALATAVIHLFRAKKRAEVILLATLITYLAVAFVVILYPPFQIACGLALASFLTGWLIHERYTLTKREFINRFMALVVAGLSSLIILGAFFLTRLETVRTLNDTAYPGRRVVASGNYTPQHPFAGNLGFQFQHTILADKYHAPTGGEWNQSGTSNFLLIAPYLLLPSALTLYRNRKIKLPLDWPLITTNACMLLFFAWLYVPGLALLGKITLLDKVPQSRLLIGFGLLNVLQIVLFIRAQNKSKLPAISHAKILIYVSIVFLFNLYIGLWAMHSFPGFIELKKVVAFALPIPVIVYFLLRKHFSLALIGFALFSVFTSAFVNPLYRGTDILTKTPLSQEIKKVEKNSPGIWVTEISYLENFAQLNGAQSLTGVYAYPQKDLWKNVDPLADQAIYNRYAHTNFTFDRDTSVTIPTKLELVTLDHFGVTTEPCSQLMKSQRVRYIVTTVSIPDSCLSLVSKVAYPAATFYIFKTSF